MRPLFTLLLAAAASAQTGTVTGRALDAEGEPLPAANALVLEAADSSLVRGALANSNGRFSVQAVPPGSYLLRVSFIGFESATAGPFDVEAGAVLEVGGVVLEAQAEALGEVTVAAERPLFEQRPDRVVVNVAGSPTLSSGTALDVVARAPGVSVDPGGGISVSGKGGVRVMVNGRVRYVPAEGIADFLAAISADNLRSVEVITTPPAGLDAEGDAGFINVVLDRPPDDATSGSVAVSGAYGGAPVGRVALSGSVRRGRVGVFATYAFLEDARDQFSVNVRSLEGGTTVATESDRDPTQRNHDARLDLEVGLTDRTALAVSAAVYETRFSQDALTTGAVTGADPTSFRVEVDELNRWRHGSAGVGLSHTLAEGHTIRASADVLTYRNANPVGYQNVFTGPSGTTETRTGSDKDTPLNIAVVAADYAVPVSARASLSVGVKGAFSRFTNRVEVEGGTLVPGVGGASESRLSEDVLAAYGELEVDLGGGTSARLGLRFEDEQTSLEDGGAPVVDRGAGRFYPNVLVSHQAGAMSLSASYARRVTRPTFNDQAPFVYFFDPFTLFSGNAALRPAVSNTVRLDANRAGLSVSLVLTEEDSTIARFQNVVLEDANAQLIRSLNLGRTRTAAATVTVPLARGLWRSETSATAVAQRVEDGPDERTQESLRVRSTQSVRLGPVVLEASGFYSGPSLGGTARFEGFGGLDVAAQTEVGGGQLALSVLDVFDSVERRSLTVLEGATVRRVLDFGQRTVQVTFSRRFGGPTRAPAQRAAEERGRAG